MVPQLTIKCQPTLSPYLNELHSAHSPRASMGALFPPARSYEAQNVAIFPRYYSGCYHCGAIADQLFIVSGAHPANVCSRCMWTCVRVSVFTVQEHHKQITIKPFMMCLYKPLQLSFSRLPATTG